MFSAVKTKYFQMTGPFGMFCDGTGDQMLLKLEYSVMNHVPRRRRHHSEDTRGPFTGVKDAVYLSSHGHDCPTRIAPMNF